MGSAIGGSSYSNTMQDMPTLEEQEAILFRYALTYGSDIVPFDSVKLQFSRKELTILYRRSWLAYTTRRTKEYKMQGITYLTDRGRSDYEEQLLRKAQDGV